MQISQSNNFAILRILSAVVKIDGRNKRNNIKIFKKSLKCENHVVLLNFYRRSIKTICTNNLKTFKYDI